MKRYLTAAAIAVAILISAAGTASANYISTGNVSCTGWSFQFTHFPTDANVTIHTHITYADGSTKDANNFTYLAENGTITGQFKAPADGHAHVAFTWTLDGPHQYTNDADLKCAPPVTTTTTTPPPPPTVPPTAPPAPPAPTPAAPTPPPTIAAPVLPGGLPVTGSGTAFLGVIGVAAVGSGIIFLRRSHRVIA